MQRYLTNATRKNILCVAQHGRINVNAITQVGNDAIVLLDKLSKPLFAGVIISHNEN